MTALLDVNVLVALFDGVHVHHEAAHAWFGAHRSRGWATCPLTENGFLRVVGASTYPGRRTTLADARERLADFRASGQHEFWPDAISLVEPGVVDLRQVAGSRQLTDVYLLALAVARGGRLASFDRRIPLRAVAGADERHLALIAD